MAYFFQCKLKSLCLEDTKENKVPFHLTGLGAKTDMQVVYSSSHVPWVLSPFFSSIENPTVSLGVSHCQFSQANFYSALLLFLVTPMTHFAVPASYSALFPSAS